MYSNQPRFFRLSTVRCHLHTLDVGAVRLIMLHVFIVLLWLWYNRIKCHLLVSTMLRVHLVPTGRSRRPLRIEAPR